MDNLRKERDELLNLKVLLEKHQAAFEAFAQEYNTVLSSLDEVNEELRFLNAEIEGTQQAIAEASKVTIYVYEGGQIGTEGFDGILPEADPEMVKQFSIDERFEDLTLRELRQLCKILAFVALLENDEKRYECIFGHEKLEAAYNSLTL